MSDDDRIRRAVKELARDGKATCQSLLALAERLGVEPARVGEACNELAVKIHACRLGCFR